MKTEQPASLSRGRITGVVAPAIALSSLSLPLVVYLPEFYSATLGLDLAMVGMIFMIVRGLDIAFDPLFGNFMDRHATRAGRFRPWLLIAAPIIMLSIAMLFMAGKGVSGVYLAAWLGLAYVGYSIMSLAQLSLIANVSPDYNDRSRVYGWWQIAFFIGMISVMLLPKLLESFGVSTPFERMKAMAWLIILIAPTTAFAAFVTVRERPVKSIGERHGLAAYFSLMAHVSVRRLLACEALMGLAGGASSTLALFYFSRVKGVEHADIGMLIVAHMLVGFATTPMWSWMARRIGKHQTLALACTAFAVLWLLLIVPPKGNYWAILFAYSASGLGYGAFSLLPRAMMADVNDEIRLKTGADHTGLLYSLLISIWKIGQALSVGVMFWLLALIGFNAGEGATNSQSALDGLNWLYIGLPFVLSLLAALVAMGYPLTAERHAEIRRELAERDALPAD